MLRLAPDSTPLVYQPMTMYGGQVAEGDSLQLPESTGESFSLTRAPSLMVLILTSVLSPAAVGQHLNLNRGAVLQAVSGTIQIQTAFDGVEPANQPNGRVDTTGS